MAGIANVRSVAPVGFDGNLIEVECDLKNGLPSLQIVGLGNKAIDEARERVRSAITNSLLDFPAKKLIVNLAPAELPKDGSHYDLAIALAILTASGQLRKEEATGAVFVGELALNGSIRPIRGAISIAETAKKQGFSTVYLPNANTSQARLISGITVIGLNSLKELYLHLKGEVLIPTTVSHEFTDVIHSNQEATLDDISGQAQAKRALIIAAAGRHNLLLTGSPGAGKTMMAKTLLSLLPPLTNEQTIDVTKLHSLAGESVDTVITQRPFRSPHHTASRTSLIGGGAKPKPGEISLAHHGVLFLDEMPEYPRATLESLRQPLEDRKISVTRAHSYAQYPADFMLIGTMNPCPCGYYGDSHRTCSCTSTQILQYQKRLSGPLLDRIDMTVTVSRVPTRDLLQSKSLSETQQTLARNQINLAHEAQALRYRSSSKYNANITSKDIKQYITLEMPAKSMLETAAEKLQLSARSYFKVIKVAQTIADLEGASLIGQNHIAEALQYRQFTS